MILNTHYFCQTNRSSPFRIIKLLSDIKSELTQPMSLSHSIILNPWQPEFLIRTKSQPKSGRKDGLNELIGRVTFMNSEIKQTPDLLIHALIPRY